jgi:hypothetical protein
MFLMFEGHDQAVLRVSLPSAGWLSPRSLRRAFERASRHRQAAGRTLLDLGMMAKPDVACARIADHTGLRLRSELPVQFPGEAIAVEVPENWRAITGDAVESPISRISIVGRSRSL